MMVIGYVAFALIITYIYVVVISKIIKFVLAMIPLAILLFCIGAIIAFIERCVL